MGYSIVATQTTSDLTSATVINQLQENITTGIPPGTIIEMALADTMAAPWLLCDGSALDRTTYATLYAAVTKSLGAVTISNGANATLTLAAGSWTEGMCIELTTTDTLPTGLSANTNYYIHVTANPAIANVSSSRELLQAGTYLTTSSAGAGTHTARFCPWGVSTAANFLVPDLPGIVTVMPGDATVNGRTKTGPSCAGDVKEDQMQLLTGEFEATRLLQNAAGVTATGALKQGVSANIVAAEASIASNTNQSIEFDSSGSPDARTSTLTTGDTRPNMIGVNKYIKYE